MSNVRNGKIRDKEKLNSDKRYEIKEVICLKCDGSFQGSNSNRICTPCTYKNSNLKNNYHGFGTDTNGSIRTLGRRKKLDDY